MMPVPVMIFDPSVKLLYDDVTQTGLIGSAMKMFIEANFTKCFSCFDDQEPTVSTRQYGHIMVGAPDIDKQVKLLLLRER